MAVFNIFDDLLTPIGETLQSDPNFQDYRIYYDHRQEEIPRDHMPAISYFPVSSTEDDPQGTSAFSLQKRVMTFRVGFLLAVYGSDDRAQLARRFFEVFGLLSDWLVEHADFDSSKGIIVSQQTPVTLDYDVTGDETGLVGTGLVTVEFQWISGTLS